MSDLRKLYKSGDFKTDPILEPYFQLRMLASSGTRAHNFIMDGVYLPPSALAKSASYIKGKSEGLHKILEPFDVRTAEIDLVQYGSDETKTHWKIKHILGANQHSKVGRLLVSE